MLEFLLAIALGVAAPEPGAGPGEAITVTCVLPNFMNGRVTDAERRPLAGAQVTLRTGTSAVATTDASGAFAFLFSPADRSSYVLQVDKQGFVSGERRGQFPATGFDLQIILESQGR